MGIFKRKDRHDDLRDRTVHIEMKLSPEAEGWAEALEQEGQSRLGRSRICAWILSRIRRITRERISVHA